MQYSFEKAAMVVLLESALDKADDKIGRRKAGGKELRAFATVVQRSVSKDLPLMAGVKGGLQVAMANSTDSLSWMIQRLVGDLFWTYRRSMVGMRRAEQQASALIDTDQAGEASVAELLAELAADGDIDIGMVSDAAGDPVDNITLDEVEDAFMHLYEMLNDIYIQCSDSQHSRLPITSRGAQVASTLSGALALADMIIEEGNAQRRAIDRTLLT